MFKTVLAAAALVLSAGAATAAPLAASQIETPQSHVIKVSDGEYCDWFAIATCHRGASAAQRSANRYGLRVINTNFVDGFRGGYFCTVAGPLSKPAARTRRNALRRAGAKTAYIKEGCNY
ncbi:MAG: hypothetical protein AAFQ42_09295 [Pseudomonadota bacterium]